MLWQAALHSRLAAFEARPNGALSPSCLPLPAPSTLFSASTPNASANTAELRSTPRSIQQRFDARARNNGSRTFFTEPGSGDRLLSETGAIGTEKLEKDLVEINPRTPLLWNASNRRHVERLAEINPRTPLLWNGSKRRQMDGAGIRAAASSLHKDAIALGANRRTTCIRRKLYHT